jgi:VWFA-related protein
VLCKLFWIAALLSLNLSAQESNSVLRTGTQLVLVPVTVTDKRGNFIDGLTADDFRLTDDNVKQTLRLDTSDTVVAPVSLVVAIQSSGISAPVLARIAQVCGIIKPIVAGERGHVAVITFDREVRVAQDFTTETNLISNAFAQVRSVGLRSARLLDAVEEGIHQLEMRPTDNRRVMLILSESRDRGSKAKLEAVMERAQRAGIQIYAGTYSVQASTFASSPADAPSMPGGEDYIAGLNELVRLGKRNAATALTTATGGRHFSFLKVGTLEDSIARTGQEIHSQYLLSFAPTASKNGGFHPIKVAVAAYPDALIRARTGYFPVH